MWMNREFGCSLKEKKKVKKGEGKKHIVIYEVQWLFHSSISLSYH